MIGAPLKIRLVKPNYKTLVDFEGEILSKLQCKINVVDEVVRRHEERVEFWLEYKEAMQNGVEKMVQSRRIENIEESAR